MARLMLDFERDVQKAVDEDDILGIAVVAATSHIDDPLYAKAFGHTDIKPGSPAMQMDSTMWIASNTKLLTTICVLQCVERGLLSLDADISSILSEFTNPQILTGFSSDNKPQLKPAINPMTLRLMLTHRAGLVFEHKASSTTLSKELNAQPDTATNDNKADNGETLTPNYETILSYEPGQGWEYGPGVDWAGKAVSRATGLRLGDYMTTHIFQPLNMNLTTFQPLSRPDIMDKMVGRVMRSKLPSDSEYAFTGPLATIPEALNTTFHPIANPDEDSGGSGLYSCAADYIKVLTSLLRNDGTLLQPATVDLLFTPQIPDTDTHYLAAWTQHPIFGPLVTHGAYSLGVEWNHSLAGIVAMNGAERRWSPGAVMWSGLPNNYWWIDRERGVCGFFANQLYPLGDRASAKLNACWQSGMWNMVGGKR